MKVLSDWLPGDPPTPGMWLVRTTMGREWDAGVMVLWDGAQYRDLDGAVIEATLKSLEYRGLAFNPEVASLMLSVRDCNVPDFDWYIVGVPR